MKKITLLALVAGLFACIVNADTATVTVTVTGGAAGATAFSDPINMSGYLDRIELVKSDDLDVIDIDIGTFSGTTLVDGWVDINALATATDVVVIRPRRVGTGVSGTALTHAITAGTGITTNHVTQVLVAPYERILVGGNAKMKLTAGINTNATVTATFYYERLAR